MKHISQFFDFRILLLVGMATSNSVVADTLGDEWGTAERENAYYRITRISVPEPEFIEVGSFATLVDGRIALGTRRGEVFFVDGLDENPPRPEFQKFVSGLDEVLGLAVQDHAIFATQQAELTRLEDPDRDGRADRFDAVSDVWGFDNYHEFAMGSEFDDEGNLYVALCLSESYHSKQPFRGWALKITPEGETIPVASGIRSPLGIGYNAEGALIYSESQGPWNGSCSIKHLKQGGFMGHPISFNWYPLAPNMGPVPELPDSPSRLEIERLRVPELVPYAVVFPYRKMGRSISGFSIDCSGGKFGPFENQIFIGDYTLSVIMRATMEQVNGVWQGACYPFREGLSTGILDVHFTPGGHLLSGGTNRGWPVRGTRSNLLERLDWTGETPFEIKEITARADGFRIAFTKPVDRQLGGDPENYQVLTYTHIYHQGYGSPEVDQRHPKVLEAVVSDDGLCVDLVLEAMTQGHVHEFDAAALSALDGTPILHRNAYYTLNEIPRE